MIIHTLFLLLFTILGSINSYQIEDILSYYILNIGKKYQNNQGYISFIKAQDFKLVTQKRGEQKLQLSIVIAAKSSELNYEGKLQAEVILFIN
jgi:hypothetical protein